MAEIIFPCKFAKNEKLTYLAGIKCVKTNRMCVCSHLDSFEGKTVMDKNHINCPGYERNEYYGDKS